jgi:hypothetical protein
VIGCLLFNGVGGGRPSGGIGPLICHWGYCILGQSGGEDYLVGILGVGVDNHMASSTVTVGTLFLLGGDILGFGCRVVC